MKKHTTLILALACVVLFLFFLTRNGITLQGAEDTYPREITSISVRLKNNTLRTVQYGAPFSVECCVDGNWIRLSDPEHPVNFELGTKTLPPLCSVELTYAVSLFSDFREAGVYRLAMDVRSGTETQTPLYTFTVADA